MMNREEPDEGSGTMFRPWLSQQATNQFQSQGQVKRGLDGWELLL